MTPERWKEIKTIIEKALERPENERSAFIEQACNNDLELKKEVSSLLYFHNEIGGFLEKPVIPNNFDSSNITLRNNSSILNQEAILQGRYLILEKIGQGGMGAVYKAQDKRLNNTVALKQIIVSGGRLEKAFEQEAQLLAKLRHPSLPNVIDYFTEESCQFLVMEFIDGETLSQMLAKRGKPFEMSQIFSWTEQLLDVLSYLHSHNPPIIHRDVKPNNLKLTENGQIVLLDFGLAKGLVKHSDTYSHSIESSISGYTPHYAPLEQINGLGTDCRSDIYSTAATIYHLATNIKPADATYRAVATLNKEGDPLKLAHLLNSGVEQKFAQLLSDCLSQNINQRPTSVNALLGKLRSLQNSIDIGSSNSASTTRGNNTLAQSKVNTLVFTNLPNKVVDKLNSSKAKSALTSFAKRGFIYLSISLVVLLLTVLLAKNLPGIDSEAIATQVKVNQLKQQASQKGVSQDDKVRRLLEGKHFGETGFKGDPVSIDIKGVQLYDMLRFFSDNYGLNFVVDESVPKMIVTMKVNDIPWGDAFSSVLDTNNLAYRVENNVVRIVPKYSPFVSKQNTLDKKTESKKLKN